MDQTRLPTGSTDAFASVQSSSPLTGRSGAGTSSGNASHSMPPRMPAGAREVSGRPSASGFNALNPFTAAARMDPNAGPSSQPQPPTSPPPVNTAAASGKSYPIPPLSPSAGPSAPLIDLVAPADPLAASAMATTQLSISSADVATWRLGDIEMRETVGTGTFGRVRLCKHRAYAKFFAMKILKKQDVIRLKQVEHVLSEVAVLAELAPHPFIVNLVRGFMDADRLYLLMEYVTGGELFSHLRKAGKFPNDVAKFYACEVILALEHIHSKDIIYRDLKPENVLLDDRGHAKITDFGFAKKVTERTYTLCGTPEYIAPEIIQNRGHGKAVDFWALGIMLYEMIVGYPPFFDESPLKTYEKILEGRLQFPRWVDPKTRDLIRALLTTDPTKRIGTLRRGIHDVKRHKFFLGVDWEVVLQRKLPAPIPVRVAKDGDSRYFDRYPESQGQVVKTLSKAEQELFAGFTDKVCAVNA